MSQGGRLKTGEPGRKVTDRCSFQATPSDRLSLDLVFGLLKGYFTGGDMNLY